MARLRADCGGFSTFPEPRAPFCSLSAFPMFARSQKSTPSDRSWFARMKIPSIAWAYKDPQSAISPHKSRGERTRTKATRSGSRVVFDRQRLLVHDLALLRELEELLGTHLVDCFRARGPCTVDVSGVAGARVTHAACCVGVACFGSTHIGCASTLDGHPHWLRIHIGRTSTLDAHSHWMYLLCVVDLRCVASRRVGSCRARHYLAGRTTEKSS